VAVAVAVVVVAVVEEVVVVVAMAAAAVAAVAAVVVEEAVVVVAAEEVAVGEEVCYEPMWNDPHGVDGRYCYHGHRYRGGVRDLLCNY
jgi:hypothetical protein